MVIVPQVSVVDLRVDYDDVWVTAITLQLRLAVTKGTRDRQTTRNDAHGTLRDWSTWAAKHDVVVLVDFTTRLCYSYLLSVLRRLVVVRERSVGGTLIARHACSRVTRVSDPNLIVYDEHHDGAGARLVAHLRLVLTHERLFSFLEA